MFDIGFFELLVLAIVGLFVIGPERLPGTIKTCALWFGRIKRNLLDTRRELERQIGADDIRRELHNEQVLHNLEKMKDTRAELEAKLRQWESGQTVEHKPEDNAPTNSPEATETNDHSSDTSSATPPPSDDKK